MLNVIIKALLQLFTKTKINKQTEQNKTVVKIHENF